MLKQVTRIIRALHIPSIEELERDYLNSAANGYDLEMRQREIDSGRFRRGVPSFY